MAVLSAKFQFEAQRACKHSVRVLKTKSCPVGSLFMQLIQVAAGCHGSDCAVTCGGEDIAFTVCPEGIRFTARAALHESAPAAYVLALE